ncbi:Polysialic acid O-acetyltransferase [Sporomusa silvacetica DSM 10669]|uniref:Polysialic acid O-acetyltransferase n=1 Tax=Sporomusa silvacetica DSM 10669 TaxID=1123289 RepID=A0ABZ3IHB4_9FIRM|nr:acyltransferase [Sporomusa silvacetica]OZC13123.1 maltose O-acetyltransferase [Sporomusa silvacetica DSM 10669]
MQNCLSWLHSIFRYKIKDNGKGNTVINNGVLKEVKIVFSGDNNVVEIGKGTLLRNTRIIVLGNNNKLNIGERCKIRDSLFKFWDNNELIKLGNYTTSSGTDILVSEPNLSITIGNDCMFSSGISISNGDGHTIIDLKTRKRINFDKNITIGNHVWVGAYSRILKGANINNNSIVGLGSVVTGEVPNNSIVGGIPARVIKKSINWIREKYSSTEPIPEALILDAD